MKDLGAMEYSLDYEYHPLICIHHKLEKYFYEAFTHNFDYRVKLPSELFVLFYPGFTSK